MSQKAIIETKTRVIRRITTDINPSISTDETVVDLSQDIDLANGPWKLDLADKKVAATTIEAKEAGVDRAYLESEQLRKLAELKQSLQDIEKNVLLPIEVRTFATKYLALLG